jgi:diguanylate cyclase (GGDEF)-like protein
VWASGIALSRLAERVRRQAETDPLTGLLNRRAFITAAEREHELAARTGADLAVVLIDLDDFKVINDRDGHAAGDAALVDLGRELTAALREVDSLARIGGDEFAVLTSMPPDEIAALTTRVNRTLSTEQFAMAFGTTHCPEDGETAAELFHKADDRLFAAKLVRQNRATVVALALADAR